MAQVTVQFTRHLARFFPVLAQRERIALEAETVADLVLGLDAEVPGLARYLVDERGGLRKHVNVFVDNAMVSDRGALSDPLQDGAVVFVMQALSGG